MPVGTRTAMVAALSLLFTYLFFFEYLPPVERVHIPYDLEGYHYPLIDYAYQSLSHGRFPEWDPAIFCGIGFASNVQAALFYPPTWLVFLANIGRMRVAYLSVEILQIAHVWLAFFLCFLWLRGRRLRDLASILGAGIYAFSGYVCMELQHQGLVVGFAWFPLGLMGIDEAVDKGQWRPLWKLAAASALCFLAGYTPTWFVFVVCAAAYALARSRQVRVLAGAIAALCASLLIAMVQLLPTWEASRFMVREPHYGAGIREPAFYLSYFLPNYFNFGLEVPVNENPGKEYLYMGAPALLGLALLVRHRRPRVLIPLFVLACVGLIGVTNPFGIVWTLIQHSATLASICRSYYFLAAVTLAIAGLAAFGIDDYLRRSGTPVKPAVAWLAGVLMLAWSLGELARWLAGGHFAFGWRSVFDPAMTLALAGLVLYALRAQCGRARILLCAVLIIGVGTDYKVFGTSKRFSAGKGATGESFGFERFAGMEAKAYDTMLAHPEFRLLLDGDAAPDPLELRHAGLSSPHGLDPFFTDQYRELVQTVAKFRTAWEFDLDPDNDDGLHLLGVGYVVTSEGGRLWEHLQADPKFRRIDLGTAYYRVFQYVDARPAYGWEEGSSVDSVQLQLWQAERREFRLRFQAGGRFVLHEQFLPGWEVFIDGQRLEIERWHGAFQAVQVPAGEHNVRFQFRSRTLRLGAWISVLSLAGMCAFMRRR
jgi:hypothetical protein